MPPTLPEPMPLPFLARARPLRRAPARGLGRWCARAGWALPGVALLGLALLAGCGAPRPTGELLGIQDDQHAIAHPSKIGASATGSGCGTTQKEALTSARRVAQFNLRTLTGEARYNVRFDLVSETQTPQGFCVELSAKAVEPIPYVR
jgi:hypothetical protein